MTTSNVPFHFDDGHFTLDASYEVAALIDRLGVIDRPDPAGAAGVKPGE
jgi:hypothetical protein